MGYAGTELQEQREGEGMLEGHVREVEHTGLHDTVGSVRPPRDTQRPCSTLSHIHFTMQDRFASSYGMTLAFSYGIFSRLLYRRNIRRGSMES
jgi:hypothetical protein